MGYAGTAASGGAEVGRGRGDSLRWILIHY